MLGEEHTDTLNSISNLAATLGAQGDLAGARRLQEQVLDIRRRVLGEEHPDTLNSINNLAGTLGAQGNLAGAHRLQEQLLDIACRVLGEKHPHTSMSAFNLFGTLLQADDPESTPSLFAQHLAWLLERHPATLGADQRYIRDQLAAHYRHDQPTAPSDYLSHHVITTINPGAPPCPTPPRKTGPADPGPCQCRGPRRRRETAAGGAAGR